MAGLFILQYGVLGVLIVIVMFFVRQMLEREQLRADKLEDDNARMAAAIQRAIGSLGSATSAEYGLVDENGHTVEQRQGLRELEAWWKQEQQRKEAEKKKND